MIGELLANADYQKLIVGGGLALVAFFVLWQVLKIVFAYLTGRDKSEKATETHFFNVIELMLNDFKSAINNNTLALNNNTETLQTLKSYIANQQDQVNNSLVALSVQVTELGDSVKNLEKKVDNSHLIISTDIEPQDLRTV